MWERKTWVFAPTFYFGKNRVVDNFSVTEKVREVAKTVIVDKRLELVHVEVVGSSKKPSVRIFIDSENGITHDDCSGVSTRIGEILDERDFISSAYVLEVSSPGIERGLYSLPDFQRFIGHRAKVKTKGPIDGQRNFLGRIEGVEEQEIVFEDRTTGLVQIPFDKIKRANLDIDFKEDFKRAGSINRR